MSCSLYLPPKTDILKLFVRYPRYMAFLIKRKFDFRNRYFWVCSDKRLQKDVPPPLVYKLYLTYKCNLHCGMCMFWGEKGIYGIGNPKAASEELDFAVIDRILKETGHRHPSFILSGGEPLLYSRFHDLVAILKKYQCFAYVCTNGTMLEKYIPAVIDNPFLIFYLSVDGPSEINDALRGEGSYTLVVDNLRRLKALRQNNYVGIQFTLQKENVPYLYDTCKEMVAAGADWILINLKWYLSPQQAYQYETVLQKEYNVTPQSHSGFLLPYDIDKEEFIRQCQKIRSEKWPIQISSYLKKPEDIYAYTDYPDINPYNQFCFKQWIRMDVLPDGQVTPCIQYPDLKFGSLMDTPVKEIWNGQFYKQFRKKINRELLPVCSRCYCLYLYDAHRQVL